MRRNHYYPRFCFHKYCFSLKIIWTICRPILIPSRFIYFAYTLCNNENIMCFFIFITFYLYIDLYYKTEYPLLLSRIILWITHLKFWKNFWVFFLRFMANIDNIICFNREFMLIISWRGRNRAFRWCFMHYGFWFETFCFISI